MKNVISIHIQEEYKKLWKKDLSSWDLRVEPENVSSDSNRKFQ